MVGNLLLVCLLLVECQLICYRFGALIIWLDAYEKRIWNQVSDSISLAKLCIFISVYAWNIQNLTEVF